MNTTTPSQPPATADSEQPHDFADEHRADVPIATQAKRRGFAALDRTRVQEIARAGGIAAHRNGKAHCFTSAEAQRAGKKGGSAPHRSRGPTPSPSSSTTNPTPHN
jgi:general stress protein YciG